MSKELVISAAPHETRVAIVEDGQLCEIYVEREKEFALVGSIYKGRVTRVLPGMQSAFVDIGLDTDAFLYVSDFIEDLEEYDQVTTVETKVQRMEQEGGAVFAPSTNGGGAPAPAAEPSESDAVAPEAAESAEAEEAPAMEAAPEAQPSESSSSRSEDLPGETRAPRGANPAPPPSTERRGRDDFCGRGRFGGRGGDRGGDRGRGGRGGRDRFGGRGRGREGGRDFRGNRSGGRDFPSSKYASPHRPYEPPSVETADSSSSEAFEPIILPGESLSKYRGRDSSAAAVQERPAEENLQIGRDPSVAFDELHAEAQFAQDSAVETAEVPEMDHAPEAVEPAEEPVEARAEEQPLAAAEPERAESAAPEARSMETEPAASERFEPQMESPASTTSVDAEPELSEAQRINLAEQLAEVEHEAAQEAAAFESSRMEYDADESSDTGAEEEPAEGAAEESAPEYEADDQDAEIREGILAAAGDAGAMDGQHESSERQPTEARIQSNPRARFQRPMRRGGRRDQGRGGRDRHRGGRPHHHHGRPQAPKRTQLISELLKAGQEIIVQIAKEPLGKKGARITSHVALPGRFLVYMPTVNHVGVSRKINSGDKRARLRHLVHEAKTKYPGGFIVRTAAENATEEEIQTDIDFLGRSWLEMLNKSEQKKAPALLHRDLNLVERILRDHLSSNYTSIWIDNEEEYTKVLDFVGRFQPALVNRVKLYTKDTPIFEELGIQQEIDKSLRPKVWLKSGGYIVINHTEALVAIDVNTGKFVGKGSNRLEDTIVRTNIEAVKEVVRQIRLRDLGGIIVVDFIDMEERKNRDKVMAALDEALRRDRAPSKALGFNEFGLVAITRKRTKQALERVLCQPCPYCTGSGMVKSVPTICYEIQAEARKMALEMDGASLTLRVNPEIAKALKTRESALIEELEHWTRKSVIIQGDPTLHFEQYDIH